MIRYIKGEYLYYSKGAIIVETKGGIGFRIFVSDTSPLLNSREGDTLRIYTYLQVKDDAMMLFGFSDPEALELFEQLITVKGVGPKAGLAIMSIGTPNQIKSHIVGKDPDFIAQAQGIGKKTAERVILELCEKVTALPVEGGEEITPESGGLPDSERAEAVVALVTLGYSKSEAEDAISHVPDEDLTAEEYIKKALRYLL
jgi:Holliday junction DNA helicase RuvA